MQDQWNEAFFVENSNIVISESTGCKYVKRTYKIWIWQLFWKIVTPKTWLQEEMQCENQISLLIQCGTSRLYWVLNKQQKEGRSVTWNKVLSKNGKCWKRTSLFYINQRFVNSRCTYKTRSHMVSEVPLGKSRVDQRNIFYG